MRLRVVFLLALAACTTLEYRGVQAQFNDAVAADNASIENPLFTPTAGYDAVLAKLTPEYIKTLDERLQPNAWMLRAISAWRTGDLDAAKTAADTGEPLAPAHSRDKIGLLAVYGLIADTEANTAWQAVKKRNKTAYDKHKGKFATAWNKLTAAENAIGPATPKSMAYYVSYQKWRVTSNWAGAITSCKKASPAERTKMRTDAKAILGAEPTAAADAARGKVKGQLRRLIEAQGGG